MYIACRYERCIGGYHFDDKTRCFKNWSDAFDYCQKLNLELAKLYRCKTKFLEEYYDIEEIKGDVK